MRTIVRLPNWLGDTILALPAIRGWSAQLGDDLILAGRDSVLSVAATVAPRAMTVRLTCVRGSRRGFWEDARRLRAVAARRAILLPPSFSSALMMRVAGVPELWGWSEQGRSALLTRRVARDPRGCRHLCDEFRALAQMTGVDANEMSAPPFVPPPANISLAGFANGHASPWITNLFAGGWVAICAGARYGSAKRWPTAHFGALARTLVSHGVPGIIVGTADEWAAGEEIARAAGSSGWRNLCGTASPLEAAELLRGASAAICPDSGAMHLAAAVGSRVVALFGPSEPTWTGPQGGGHRVLRKRWRCAPCYRRHCPYGDPAPCMAMIAPEEVMRATRAIRRRSAVFFDRDGTLIEHVPYLRDPSQVRLLPNVAAALQSARAAGFRLIVASNQSGIARGYFAREHLDAVNGEMCRQLAAQGVGLDAIYTCPHHPDHAGDCKCRKPLPGLLLAAAIDFDLDLSRSFMVGDTVDDLRAGAAAGARPVLIDASGERGDDVLPGSIVVRDLATALAAILAQGARTGAAKAD